LSNKIRCRRTSNFLHHPGVSNPSKPALLPWFHLRPMTLSLIGLLFLWDELLSLLSPDRAAGLDASCDVFLCFFEGISDSESLSECQGESVFSHLNIKGHGFLFTFSASFSGSNIGPSQLDMPQDKALFKVSEEGFFQVPLAIL
jgi:hypothetical protein